MQAKFITMNCLKLCSRYEAISTSAADLPTTADSTPSLRRRHLAGSMVSSPLSEQISSASENREIDEMVQEICDITLGDDNSDDDNDKDDKSTREENLARQLSDGCASQCQLKGCGIKYRNTEQYCLTMKIKLLDLFVVGRINIRTTNEPFLIGF
jgi:hypothetical protein